MKFLGSLIFLAFAIAQSNNKTCTTFGQVDCKPNSCENEWACGGFQKCENNICIVTEAGGICSQDKDCGKNMKCVNGNDMVSFCFLEDEVVDKFIFGLSALVFFMILVPFVCICAVGVLIFIFIKKNKKQQVKQQEIQELQMKYNAFAAQPQNGSATYHPQTATAPYQPQHNSIPAYQPPNGSSPF